jgi:hypothetical protein
MSLQEDSSDTIIVCMSTISVGESPSPPLVSQKKKNERRDDDDNAEETSIGVQVESSIGKRIWDMFDDGEDEDCMQPPAKRGPPRLRRQNAFDYDC